MAGKFSGDDRWAAGEFSGDDRWAAGEFSGDDRWAAGELSGDDRCKAVAEPPARGLYKGGVGGGVPPVHLIHFPFL